MTDLLIRNNRREAGQGLIEYALILTLIGMVVIAVLAIMGPAIGNVYTDVLAMLAPSSVNGMAPTPTVSPPAAPTPAPQWTFCATEHDYCSFSGTATVRYGENGTFTTRVLTNGTRCDNSVFGDPLYGILKHCDVLQ